MKVIWQYSAPITQDWTNNLSAHKQTCCARTRDESQFYKNMNQASSIAKSLKKHTPRRIWKIIRKSKHLMLIQARRLIENLGFIITRATDYYGPTPSENALRRKSNRWIKPSSLKGVHYDLGKMRQMLANLCDKYLNEFEKLPPYNSIRNAGFGPGYPQVDAFVS